MTHICASVVLYVSITEAPDYYWVYGQCRHDLCMCDAEAVECFKRSHFNELYKDYEKEKCV